MAHLRLEYLGEPLFESSDLTGTREIETEPIEIPSEGIEFWVAGEFVHMEGGMSGAVGIEVSSDSREEKTQTVWSLDSDTAVADAAVFTWDDH